MKTLIKSTILTIGLASATFSMASGMHDGEHKKMETKMPMHDSMNHDDMPHSEMGHTMETHEKMMGQMDKFMSMPSDGEMLMGAPNSIMLHFPKKVTITSIIIEDEQGNALPIEIKLDDKPVSMFEYTFDESNKLPASTYTVKFITMDGEMSVAMDEFWFMVH